MTEAKMMTRQRRLGTTSHGHGSRLPAAEPNANLLLRRSLLPGWVLLLAILLLAVAPVALPAQTFQSLPALSFTKLYQGGNPVSQIITVTSTAAPIRFSVSVVNFTGGNWLSVSPAGCCAYTPQVITATANPDISLAPGIYSAQIDIRSVDGKETMVAPVSLVVEQPSATFLR